MTSSVFSAVNRSEAATSPAANEDQGGQGAVKVVAGLERGANGGRQEDLVHLEEQPETDRQDDLSVNAAERQPVQAMADLGRRHRIVIRHHRHRVLSSPVLAPSLRYLARGFRLTM